MDPSLFMADVQCSVQEGDNTHIYDENMKLRYMKITQHKTVLHMFVYQRLSYMVSGISYICVLSPFLNFN